MGSRWCAHTHPPTPAPSPQAAIAAILTARPVNATAILEALDNVRGDVLGVPSETDAAVRELVEPLLTLLCGPPGAGGAPGVPPSLVADSEGNRLRRGIMEFLGRISFSAAHDGVAGRIAAGMLAVIRDDNEHNAHLAMRITFDIHRIAVRPPEAVALVKLLVGRVARVGRLVADSMNEGVDPGALWAALPPVPASGGGASVQGMMAGVLAAVERGLPQQGAPAPVLPDAPEQFAPFAIPVEGERVPSVSEELDLQRYEQLQERVAELGGLMVRAPPPLLLLGC